MHAQYVTTYFVKGAARTAAPALAAAAARCEAEARWVAAEVAHAPRAKDQAALFTKFVAAAEHCQRLRNFFSLFNVVCALGSPDVLRLKKMHKLVPEKTRARLAALEGVINPSRNMKVYRDALAAAAAAGAPCVPFLPLHLKDLVFMNEVASVDSAAVVNFDKCTLVARCVAAMDMGPPYAALAANPAAQAYLTVRAPVPGRSINGSLVVVTVFFYTHTQQAAAMNPPKSAEALAAAKAAAPARGLFAAWRNPGGASAAAAPALPLVLAAVPHGKKPRSASQGDAAVAPATMASPPPPAAAAVAVPVTSPPPPTLAKRRSANADLNRSGHPADAGVGPPVTSPAAAAVATPPSSAEPRGKALGVTLLSRESLV